MVGIENINETIPVFVPPRKRQSSKKVVGVQNYVDHIVSVQVNFTKHNEFLIKGKYNKAVFFCYFQPQYKISSSLEDLLSKTKQPSLDLDRKQQIHNTIVKASSKSSIDKLTKKRSCHEINLFIEDSKSETIDTPTTHNETSMKDDSFNVTPTSYSEDSIDFGSRARSIDGDGLTMRQFKKRVNILTSTTEQPTFKQNLCSSSISFENDLDSKETSLLNMKSSSLLRANGSKCTSSENYLTMTGTIKRGKKKGQSVDLQLTISRDELEKINSNAIMMQQDQENSSNACCACSVTSGIHVLLLSIISLPFVFLVTMVYAFYIGTITWYNMFTYFIEEKSYLHKLFMSPLLILAYPIGILLCTIGLAVYSGIVQINTRFTKWSNEIADIEKGFFGWLCSFLHLSDCSPYEVVILTDLKSPNEMNQPTHSSTEELSL